MNPDLKDQHVLLTGGGFVGTELARAILQHPVKALRILDNNEQRLYELQRALPDPRVRLLHGDIREKDRLSRALRDVDVVVHTAGMKHVLICEYNPFEAVKTNVVGTQNLIEASIDAGVKRFLFTSSDKAVDPANVMGSSKLLAEKLVIAGNFYRGATGGRFSVVRFGNIFGSSGSVVPTFRAQIAAGEPLTITDPETTRYVLSPKDMVRLVLSCVSSLRGGEIFIPKMPAFKLADLARIMEASAGKSRPEWKVIGMRPGETLHEDLLTPEEVARAVDLGFMVAILPSVSEFYTMPGEYAHLPRPKNLALDSSQAEILGDKGLARMLLEVGA